MKRQGFVLLLFTFLSILITWPLILHPTTLIPEVYDELAITWYLNWDIHALTSGLSVLRHFFDANIFYPYQNTLAFSDFMLPEAILALPVVALFGQPLLAHNFNVFTGLILTGYASFLFFSKVIKKTGTALLGAMIFDFSIVHLAFIGRLQLLSAWPWILAWYFLMAKKYGWYAVFLVLSAWTNVLTMYFLFLIAAWTFILKIEERRKIFWSTLFGAMAAAPLLIPYYLVSRQWHFVRPITDAINFSLYLPDLFLPNYPSRLGNYFLFGQRGGTYPGLSLLLLICCFLILFLRKRFDGLDKERKQGLIYFGLIGFSCLILAMGPALHVLRGTIHLGPLRGIPLPYAILYFLVPGMAGFRSVWLWDLPMFFALTATALIYFRNRVNILAITVGVILLLAEISWPMKWVPVASAENFPPEQKWLASHFQGAPIIEFPVYNWDDGLNYRFEDLRMYYSTIHWHPMFNGTTSFTPPERQEKIKWLQKEFPSVATINYLHDLGIKLVLVPRSWEMAVLKFSELHKQAEFADAIILTID